MAVFNPSIGPDTQERGISTASQGIGTNQTFKTLFEGIETIGVGGAVALDKKIQSDIYKQADSSVSTVRDLFGVSDATRPADIGKAVPSELQVQQERLSRLKKGYEAGTITETHYLGMLQDIVKGLRSKYPGYEMQIDDTIQKITGVTPANSIIDALQREAAASKSANDQAANRRESLITNHAGEIERVFPGMLADGRINDLSTAQLQAGIGKIQALDMGRTNRSTDLSIADKIGTLDHNDLLRDARQTGVEAAASFVTAGLNSIPGGVKGIRDLITKYGEGVPPDPETLSKMAQGLKDAKIKTRDSVRISLSQATDPDNPRFSIWANLSDKEQAEVLNNASAPIDEMIENVGAGNWTALTASSIVMTAQIDARAGQIIKDNDVFKELAGLTKAMGNSPAASQALNMWTAIEDKNGITNQNKLITAMGIGFASALASGNSPKDANDIISAAGKKDETGTAVYKNLAPSLLQFIQKMTSDPTVIDVTAENVIKSVFQKNGGLSLEKQYLPKDRERVFAALTSPAATKRIQDLSKNDPSLWDNYTTWARTWFPALVTKRISDILSLPEDVKDTGKFEYLDTGVLKFTPDKFVARVSSGNVTKDMWERNKSSEVWHDPMVLNEAQRIVQEHVNAMNVVFSTMKPITEAEGGDFGAIIRSYLPMLGIKLPDTEKDQSKMQHAQEPEKTPAQKAINDLLESQQAAGYDMERDLRL